MTEPKALALVWERSDATYFRQHPDRKLHIRKAYKDECRGEFWTLGDHEENRRRILLCRIDIEGKPLPDHQMMKIPFLAFSDEDIEDTDDILFPIVHEIMMSALDKTL